MVTWETLWESSHSQACPSLSARIRPRFALISRLTRRDYETPAAAFLVEPARGSYRPTPDEEAWMATQLWKIPGRLREGH
jgi:hypothetical protein